MKIVKLPGTDTAVNTRYVTAIVDHPNPMNYYKEPLPPYVSVRFSLGVQQGDVSVYGMTLDEVVALLNDEPDDEPDDKPLATDETRAYGPHFKG